MPIRLMTLADYDRVRALWLRTPGLGLNTVDDSREGIARYLARNPTTCFVAEEGEVLVGAILAGHDGRRGTIGHTAVDAAHQRQGIGRQLVEHVLRAMADAQIAKVNLVVFAWNASGNAFWEHLGFTARTDLIYRNRALQELERVDT